MVPSATREVMLTIVPPLAVVCVVDIGDIGLDLSPIVALIFDSVGLTRSVFGC